MLGQDVSHAKLKKAAIRFCKRLRLTILAIIFPEFFLGRAWADREAASKSVTDFNYHANVDGRHEADCKWTAPHALYANMGGFILKVQRDALTHDQRRTIGDWQQRMSELSPPGLSNRMSGVGVLTRSSCFRLKMLVQVHWLWTYVTNFLWSLLTPANQPPPSDLDKKYIAPVTIWYLNADQISVLRSSGVLQAWPRLAEELIEDKSDGNAGGKLISIVTIMRLVATIFRNRSHGMAVTPIEATAMAHAVVALITYALWFGKPLDVNTCTSLDFDHTRLNVDTLRDLEEYSGWSFTQEQRRHDVRLPVPNDIDWRGSALRYRFWGHLIDVTHVDAGFLLGGILFGCVHVGAFWFTFDNLGEKVVWLVATMVILLTVPLISVVNLLLKPLRPAEGSVDHSRPGLWYNVTLGAHYLGTLCYLAARGYLLVESLRYW